MTISAKIIADSVSPAGICLVTMQLRYPRFIHSEFMTHRVFSRNASSSRAIPVERMIAELRRDPAMPVYWGSNKPGMQAGEEVDSIHNVTSDWLEAMENAIYKAQKLIASGLHKQIANRILEPWAHINVVVTATDWMNFFDLRRHPDAQPEMRVLAEAMYKEMVDHKPVMLQPGEWHLPYVMDDDRLTMREYDGGMNLEDPRYFGTLIKVSAARCARVSYLTHDGRTTTIEEDLALYDRLVGSVPLHASPCEHQATPDILSKADPNGFTLKWNNPEDHGNFDGWRQYRKILERNFHKE